MQDTKQLHRVRIGPLATVQSADETVAQLNAMGMSDHRVVIE
ncbi:MAG: SPOR domain-containing protein [Gammaproteobacteria bacterium]